MRIYDAIMRAADHIEANPDEFNFHSCVMPSCGTPGCAIGWIAYYKGDWPISSIGYWSRDGLDHLGCSGWQFYKRMRKLLGGTEWMRHAGICAAGLRLYAAKYHTPTYDGDVPATWSDCAWKPKGVQA